MEMGKGEMSEEGWGREMGGEGGAEEEGLGEGGEKGGKVEKAKWARKGENSSGFLLSKTQVPPHRAQPVR